MTWRALSVRPWRVAAAEARNNATVASAEARAAACVGQEAELVRLLRLAQAARAPAPVPWHGGAEGSGSFYCSSEQRAAVDARVSSPGDSLANAAAGVSGSAYTYRLGRALRLLLATS